MSCKKQFLEPFNSIIFLETVEVMNGYSHTRNVKSSLEC